MTNEQLERRLRSLSWGEKQVSISFLRHLSTFDERKAYEERGYSSLFQYCTKELLLSEDEAYLRIQTARVSRKFPEVLAMLSRGELHLSGLVKLAPHLTPANAQELLGQAASKSKREIERIVAAFEIGAPKADSIRMLPSRTSDPASPRPNQQEDTAALLAAPLKENPSAPLSPAPQSGGDITPPPLMARISFTAPDTLLMEIERAKALLRYKYPFGRMSEIIGEAIACLLLKVDPDRAKKSNRKPAGSHKMMSRRIPTWVKVDVWRRDGGRCSYVSEDGKRCSSTEWLEYDHILAWALGGASDDPANVRLLCRTHNQYFARRIFGRCTAVDREKPES